MHAIEKHTLNRILAHQYGANKKSAVTEVINAVIFVEQTGDVCAP